MGSKKTMTRRVMGLGWDRFKYAACLVALAFLFLPAAPVYPQTSASPASSDANMLESAGRMILGPATKTAQFNYIMSGRVRLLFFWKGADDVGGGYVRRGFSQSDPNVRLIQVLFGSDPRKAPRGINNWGAGTEAIADASETFFGFMKSTNPESVDNAQADIQKQKEQGKYAFIAIVAFVDQGHALSR